MMFSSALPKYLQLKKELQELIENGTLPPDSLMPPENEMVIRFKVSRVTVRAALKELESEGYISRERGRGTFVKEIKKEKPGLLTKEVTLMCESNVDSYFTSEFFTELSKHLTGHRHETVFRSINNKPIIQRLKEVGADRLRDNGLVIMNDIAEDVADFIHLNKIPFVALGSVHKNLLSSVEGSHVDSIHWAVEHLVKKHGKKRIALLDGWSELSYVSERINAYEAATRKAGVWDENLLITQPDSDPESRYPNLEQWFQKGIDFDAAICYSSPLTRALLREIVKRGQKSVPNDISLITVEDLTLDGQLPYKLTKIQPDITGMAAAVADVISEQLEGRITTWNRKVNTQIIMGESCGCL